MRKSSYFDPFNLKVRFLMFKLKFKLKRQGSLNEEETEKLLTMERYLELCHKLD